MAGRYAGRLAIVAGGLGGLGSCTAKLLHAQGASLALLYAPFEASRREEVLAKTFGTPSPSRVAAYECDITSEPSVKSAFGQISSALERQRQPNTTTTPSILINSAGFVSVKPIHETSAEEASRNIIPNLLGPFVVSNAFFHLYRSALAQRQNGGPTPPGRIVSVSSQAAHKALPNHAAYCASKAGLTGLVRCQALEWGPFGITSNAVSPTVAMTELGKKAWADDKMQKDMLAQIPTGRFCLPEEVASAMEWLCRDENGMINGTDLKVDGGFTIR